MIPTVVVLPLVLVMMLISFVCGVSVERRFKKQKYKQKLNVFSISDAYVEDSVCELDSILPKYWEPGLVAKKPASFYYEMREWLVRVLNGSEPK
jgi:hypothetical protein